jgi:diphthine-ammonia ligase
MKVAVLFSGGKDSCLALHMALEKGYQVNYLISIIPDNFDSFMFHKPYLKLLKKQAEMLGIKLIIQKTAGVKEKELNDLKKLIKKVKNDVEGIVVGGIASNYQGDRIKHICDEFKLKFYAPLLGFDGLNIWGLLLKNKFKVILTKIACEGIKKEFLGKIIDEALLGELRKLSEKYKFRIDFEGGEAESAVLGMPEFKKDIKIKFNIESEGEYRHFLNIKEVKWKNQNFIGKN